MSPDELGFGNRARLDRSSGQPVRQRQVRQTHCGMRGCGQQVAIRIQIGVEAQRRAAHQHLHLIAVFAGSQLPGHQAPETSEPGGRGATAANLPVERMCHSDLQRPAAPFDGYQSSFVRLLDSTRIGDPLQRRQTDGFADRQGVDDRADLSRQRADTSVDQLDKTLRHNGFAGPPPPPLILGEPSLTDLLLHDVAQVQRVSQGESVKAADGVGVGRRAQHRLEQ